MSQNENQKNEIIITMDGPGGVGKGCTTTLLCAHLKYISLETGSLYRAIALYILDNFNGPVPTDQAIEVAQKIADSGELFTHAKNPEIRSQRVVDYVPVISQIPEVRAVVMKYQHDFAASPPNLSDGTRPRGVIVEGRNVGSGVFPNATVKLYLDATLRAKAERRHKEQSDISFEEVFASLKARDESDKNRSAAAGKMAVPDDAYYIDTTYMPRGMVFDVALGIIEKVLAKK